MVMGSDLVLLLLALHNHSLTTIAHVKHVVQRTLTSRLARGSGLGPGPPGGGGPGGGWWGRAGPRGGRGARANTRNLINIIIIIMHSSFCRIIARYYFHQH